MGLKLIVFDLDGVLVDVMSSWAFVHEHYGVNNDTSLEAYLSGEIDDHEFMRLDIALWLDIKKKLHISEIREICFCQLQRQIIVQIADFNYIIGEKL